MTLPTEAFEHAPAVVVSDALYRDGVRDVRLAQQSVTAQQVADLAMASQAYIDSQIGCPSPHGIWRHLGAAQQQIARDCVHKGSHGTPEARIKYIAKLRRLDDNVKSYQEPRYKGE